MRVSGAVVPGYGRVRLGREARKSHTETHRGERNAHAVAPKQLKALAGCGDVAGPLLLGGHGPAPPIAVAKTVSGVHCSIGRAGDKRPRLMTASRWHSPNNSGR
jgi:hypothetical protein